MTVSANPQALLTCSALGRSAPFRGEIKADLSEVGYLQCTISGTLIQTRRNRHGKS